MEQKIGQISLNRKVISFKIMGSLRVVLGLQLLALTAGTFGSISNSTINKQLIYIMNHFHAKANFVFHISISIYLILLKCL